MSFTVTKNRLPDFIRAFTLIGNDGRAKSITRKFATFAGGRLATMFRNVTPSGVKWEEPAYESYSTGKTIVHGRPSTRIFGKTLAESWEPVEVNSTYEGASFTIGTSTNQAEILLKGAGPHNIPRTFGTIITFWHIKSGMAMFFGKVPSEKANVYHPGFQPLTVFSDAYRQHGKGLVKADFNRARREITYPLAALYGKDRML